jgi:predicted enzyme related to lactoylglutathione lyase
VFSVWEPRERRGAQVVNEPGAWAMSSLSTDDPEGAKRFYSELFGWDTRSFDMGGAEITMFTVPDYVGGEPQQPVPRDVVAVMAPPSDNDEGPPRWTVDFWVADVDAAVSKLSDAGGEVLVPPYELMGGAMRQAVVRDPQGAVLTLTQPPGAA